jgi:hypothetical protein
MKDQDYGIITANSVSGGRFMGTYEMPQPTDQIAGYNWTSHPVI